MPEDQRPAPRGPLDALKVPRFAGPATFARLPTLEEVGRCDVAIVGIPFDTGVTYRPGARFGPGAIRQGSRLLRSYDPSLDVEPFFLKQVVDAGDVALRSGSAQLTCQPHNIRADTPIVRGMEKRIIPLSDEFLVVIAEARGRRVATAKTREHHVDFVV